VRPARADQDRRRTGERASHRSGESDRAAEVVPVQSLRRGRRGTFERKRDLAGGEPYGPGASLSLCRLAATSNGLLLQGSKDGKEESNLALGPTRSLPGVRGRRSVPGSVACLGRAKEAAASSRLPELDQRGSLDCRAATLVCCRTELGCLVRPWDLQSPGAIPGLAVVVRVEREGVSPYRRASHHSTTAR
jgi:hypothetical protein